MVDSNQADHILYIVMQPTPGHRFLSIDSDHGHIIHLWRSCIASECLLYSTPKAAIFGSDKTFMHLSFSKSIDTKDKLL